jgi:hypothetical protein
MFYLFSKNRTEQLHHGGEQVGTAVQVGDAQRAEEVECGRRRAATGETRRHAGLVREESERHRDGGRGHGQELRAHTRRAAEVCRWHSHGQDRLRALTASIGLRDNRTGKTSTMQTIDGAHVLLLFLGVHCSER